MRTVVQVTWNTATRYGTVAIKGLLGVILVPFLLNELGKEGYGLIALVGVILSITELTDLGLRQGLGRHLAEAAARQDNQRFNELVSTALVVYIAIAILCSSILITAAHHIIPIFKISPELTPQAIYLVRWYGSASVMAHFVNPVFGSTLISRNRFDIQNNINSAVSILRGIGLFVVLSLTHMGLYGWCWVTISAMMLATISRIYSTYHFIPDIEIRLRHLKADVLTQLFSLGSKMFIFRLAGLIAVQANPIIITQFLGLGAVAVYRPSVVLTNSSRQIVDGFRQQLFPLTTSYSTNGKKEKLQEILIKATRYSTLMSIGGCVMLVVFAEPIMKVWIGNSSIGVHYQTAAWILVCIAFRDLIESTNGSQFAVLLGMNRLGFLVWVAAIFGILNLFISIYLVRYTSLGILGVAIPPIFLAAIRRPIVAAFTAKACQLSPVRYFCRTYIRPLNVLLLLGMIATAARLIFQPSSIFALAACLAITAAAWLPLCWFVGLKDSDRKIILDLLARIRGKLKVSEP